MESKITRNMRKWVVEYVVLAIIAQQEVYASDIIQTLKDKDLILVEGTLYPLLSRLKNDSLLQYSRVESEQWPPRKYYRLTSEWQTLLETMRHARTKLRNSVDAIDPQ